MINTSNIWEPRTNRDEHPIYTFAEWKMDVESGETLRMPPARAA